MNALPLKYRLEVYEGSFGNDPSQFITTTGPLPTIAVGDLFEERGHDRWQQPPGPKEVFRVKEVKHYFLVNENSHVFYQLMICLEVVARR